MRSEVGKRLKALTSGFLLPTSFSGRKGKGRAFICQFEIKDYRPLGRINFYLSLQFSIVN